MRARQAYAAFRPSYPAQAIDAALEGLGDPRGLTIADVGAGTGISARLFAERGARVIAIEPNAQMRAAAEVHPRVAWCDGHGRADRLESASVDAVVACQAFHWFATMETCTEFRRVARRRAVLLQYERDERDPFTRAYGDVVRAYATDDTEIVAHRKLWRSSPPSLRRAYGARCILRPSVSITRRCSGARLRRRICRPRVRTRLVCARDLRVLFDRHEHGGAVELTIVTFVLIADW